MVREIIQIQVGGCGNEMGFEFWKALLDEHKLDASGKFCGNIKDNEEDCKRLDKINVYFDETKDNTYVARGIAIDLEPDTINMIKSSSVAKLFKPDNYVIGSYGGYGGSGCAANGQCVAGAEIIDDVIDAVRRKAEKSDCMQGIEMSHSLGGGTGSGMGTLVLMKFRDNFPDKMSVSYSVFPRPEQSNIYNIKPYNVTLTIYELLETTDVTMVLDNESLYNICGNVLKINKPEYSQLNWIIALAMSGVTSSLRFNGHLNGDLRKLGINLVPFPRLQFLGVCQAPLLTNENNKLTVSQLTDQMWSDDLLLASFRYDDGKFLSGSSIYRGENEKTLPKQCIDESNWRSMCCRLSDDFVTWIPDHLKTSAIYVPSMSKYDTRISGTFVSNNTGMKSVFENIRPQFAKLYKKKAFLSWYTGKGMDEEQFPEADKSVKDLITEFQDKEDAVVDFEYDYDDDEDEDDDDGMYADEIDSIDGNDNNNDDNKDNNDNDQNANHVNN